MDINWISVLLHFVAARFRGPARLLLLLMVWLAQAESGNSEAARGGDENAPMRHAVVEITVTRHWSGKAELMVVTAVETTVERIVAIVVTRI